MKKQNKRTAHGFASEPIQSEASKAKAPGRVISLRMAEADLAMARRQAERKGLPYQTYIKSLLHTALSKRDKRKAG